MLCGHPYEGEGQSVTRATAKERERALLSIVYTADEVARFIDDERPDFTTPVLNNQAEQFGVEITEFYLSGSHARLQNIPGYAMDVFAGRYRHEEDRRELRVEEVTITPHDGGEDRHVPALVQHFPDLPEHLRILAATISKKSGKARKYRRLHHVNLVLVDYLQRWGTLTSNLVCKVLTSEHIPGAIWRAPFREVFYVTALGERWIYIPLVMHCLLAELFGFALVVGPHMPETADSLVRILEAFGHHLRRRSRSPVLACGFGAEYEILHRRYGLLLSDEKGIMVHDYQDMTYPGDVRELDSADPLPMSRRVLSQRLRRYHENHTFECDVAMPAKAMPPIA
jgi:hypothetical protein